MSKNQKQNLEEEEKTGSHFQIKSLVHLYDTLNCHVFQVIDTISNDDIMVR